MKTWTISNQKGGVGKTTTVVTLAGLLSVQGKKVLCIDMDSQGSLTSYFRLDPDSIEKSIYNLFKDSSDNAVLEPLNYIQKTSFEGLDILPASTALATLDRQASQFKGLGLVLSQVLSKLEKTYDVVLIDSPPMLGVLMINALAACDHLIVPVQTEFLAIKGLDRMIKTLNMIQKSRQKVLNYLIVPTMYDKRTRASISSLNTLNNKYAANLWHSYIPVDTQLRDASGIGVPAPIMSPRSRAVVAYGELLKTLQKDKTRLALVSGKGCL
ncbi:MAG: cobalamin biosynthesis protein CobQ [Piscirickettsiaceae bacterium]|nr:MAG: cobalamin biosynthesis protein CobQ [Piscirickettsiaceae bacterium]